MIGTYCVAAIASMKRFESSMREWEQLKSEDRAAIERYREETLRADLTLTEGDMP
jgi:hypothetical protein